MKALAFLLPLLLANGRADAKCAPSSLRAAVATPAGTAIPDGGGIVVVAESFYDDGKVATGDVAIQKGWKLVQGKLAVEPTIDVIAPGLAVYRHPGPKDSYALEGKTFTVAKDRVAVLDAPKVKKIVAAKSFGRKPWSEVEVVLDGKVPVNAVAIVAVDAKGKARSFGRVDAKSKVVVFAQARCETLVDGTVEPKAGDKITVFWVDAMGRTSPASKPVAITGKKVDVDE